MPVIKEVNLLTAKCDVTALLKHALTDRQLEILIIDPLIVNVLRASAGDKGELARVLASLGLRHHLHQGKTLSKSRNAQAKRHVIVAVRGNDSGLLGICLHLLDHARNGHAARNSSGSTCRNTSNQTYNTGFFHC